jgi:hypothetical protein
MSAIVSYGRPAPYRSAIGLLLLTAAFTILWIGLNVWSPGLQAAGIRSVVTRLVIHTAILVGLWLGLARTGFDPGTRVRIWLAIAIPFTA